MCMCKARRKGGKGCSFKFSQLRPHVCPDPLIAFPCVSGSSNSDLKWLHTEEIKFRFKVVRRDVQGARQGGDAASKEVQFRIQSAASSCVLRSSNSTQQPFNFFLRQASKDIFHFSQNHVPLIVDWMSKNTFEIQHKTDIVHLMMMYNVRYLILTFFIQVIGN